VAGVGDSAGARWRVNPTVPCPTCGKPRRGRCLACLARLDPAAAPGCARCGGFPRAKGQPYCAPCRRTYQRKLYAAKAPACERCHERPSRYGGPFCLPCKREVAAQRQDIPARPRCTACGQLPQHRDGRCVLCAPPLPSPSIDHYATRGWGGGQS
jgi:hypothetical protein